MTNTKEPRGDVKRITDANGRSSVGATSRRIIPGGKASAEAEHDSWLAGVPKAELR